MNLLLSKKLLKFLILIFAHKRLNIYIIIVLQKFLNFLEWNGQV